MKKLLMILFVLIITASQLYAQDTITKNDGTEIKAKILEVGTDELKYKNWDNLDGPTFIIRKSDVVLVKYSNGTNDVFRKLPVNNGATPSPEKTRYFARTNEALAPGLNYYSYRSYYDTDDYDLLIEPKYSPSRAWLNLVLPGLAQFTMGEGGLGGKYLGISLGSLALTGIGYGLYVPNTIGGGYGKVEAIVGAGLLVVGSGLSLAVTISSIVNAAKVAKLKSLYLDDLNGINYSLTIAPALQTTYTPDGLKPIPSVALNVSF